MSNINYEKLNELIKEYNLLSQWGDGLFTNTEEEKIKRATEKHQDAIDDFTRMMSSPKSKSEGYEEWALNKALGLVSTKCKYRKSGIDGRRRF